MYADVVSIWAFSSAALADPALLYLKTETARGLDYAHELLISLRLDSDSVGSVCDLYLRQGQQSLG